MRSVYLLVLTLIAASVSCAKDEKAVSPLDQPAATFQMDNTLIAKKSLDDCDIFSSPRRLKRIRSRDGSGATEFKTVTQFDRVTGRSESKFEYGVVVSFDLGPPFLIRLPEQGGVSASQAAESLISKLMQLSKSGAKVVLNCVGSTEYSDMKDRVHFISFAYEPRYEGAKSSVGGFISIQNIELN